MLEGANFILLKGLWDAVLGVTVGCSETYKPFVVLTTGRAEPYRTLIAFATGRSLRRTTGRCAALATGSSRAS